MSQLLDVYTIAKHADKVIWSRIDDEAILLNLHNGYYYTLNSIGYEMWELLDGKQTVRDIGTALCKIYDVPQDRIENDILAWLRECQAEELVTIIEPVPSTQ